MPYPGLILPQAIFFSLRDQKVIMEQSRKPHPNWIKSLLKQCYSSIFCEQILPERLHNFYYKAKKAEWSRKKKILSCFCRQDFSTGESCCKTRKDFAFLFYSHVFHHKHLSPCYSQGWNRTTSAIPFCRACLRCRHS